MVLYKVGNYLGKDRSGPTPKIKSKGINTTRNELIFPAKFLIFDSENSKL